ncbi:DUF6153 family protein [Streptomyces nigrescens]
MSGERRSTALCGRLLLFTALLLGIVMMHGLGHPAEHGAPPASDGTAATGAHAPMRHTAEPATTKSAADTHQAHQTHHAHHRAPLGETDPMSLCLAVLGAGVLVWLLGGAFAHRATGVPAAAPARLPHALRPNPPPRRPTLFAQLSVLRV